MFDGAHRNQNKVVIRRLEKQNAAREADSAINTPSSDESPELTPTTSRGSTEIPTAKTQGPLQWIIYSATKEDRGEDYENSRQLEKAQRSRLAEFDAKTTRILIPEMLKPSAEDASINFFFRHYTGTIYDPEMHNSFGQLWQPLYLASSVNSPLRLATAAVTGELPLQPRCTTKCAFLRDRIADTPSKCDNDVELSRL